MVTKQSFGHSNHVPPVDKLDEDLLDFDEYSGSEEQRERKKKKARRGSGKAKKEAKKKEQEERKKKEEQQQHSPEKLVTISSEEYQFLKQQGNLVLNLAERIKKVERAVKRGPHVGEIQNQQRRLR